MPICAAPQQILNEQDLKMLSLIALYIQHRRRAV